MFFHFKYSLLWIFIVALTLSEATFDGITENNDVCDEECLLSKPNFHLRNKRSNNSQPQCSFQGIDTSASDEPFQLFGIDSSEKYDVDSVTQANGICDCTKKGTKHAVIKKEVENKIILTDAYISCGEGRNDDAFLEILIFDYIKNVPERTLGDEPDLVNSDEHCLDENGFITTNLPGDIPCFSYMTAFSNGTYSEKNELLEGDVSYYSGPYSVNRINQSENLVHSSFSGKTFSMLGLFASLDQACNINELDTVEKNHCFSFFNSVMYSVICCCNKSPAQCAFRKYKEESLMCAKGSYTLDITSDAEPVAMAALRTTVEEMKEEVANKPFCTSRYIFTETSIKYDMPSPDKVECYAGAESVGYCILNNTVCPSEQQNPVETKINCCCRTPDLCNVDFIATKAVDRFKIMKKKVCHQPMVYSILFVRTNYTHRDDHKRPLCYIHYDVTHPNARYFLANNNLELLRDIDYEAYTMEGCTVIAANVLHIVHYKCPAENYSHNDTKLPRPLLVCTCNGSKIEEETTESTKFCDEELSQNIANIYEQRKDELMPKCLVTTNPIQNFDETVSFYDILKTGSIDMSTKSIFCYMEVIKDSVIEENDISTFSLTAGIALIENKYGEKCLDLYKKKQKENEETEKPFCDELKDDKILCCTIGMGNKPVTTPDKAIELLDEITEKVVEQRAFRNITLIKNYYQNQKSLTCRTSHKGFRRTCKHPHGCFWTDSSVGEVKTTVFAGCIDMIPELLEKNSSNPIYHSLQTCVTISKIRRLKKLDEKKKAEEPYRCFATSEINYPDEKDQLTNVFVVCCCTEIDEFGKCEKKDNAKKVYGAKVIDVGNNKLPKQHKKQIYSVPF